MREHTEAVGFSLGSPADLYGLTCKHHNHELDAVERERLGGGDEPPDDQGVHQVGAVGEPAEGMKSFQLSRALMGTWNEMPRSLPVVVEASTAGIAPRRTHGQSSSPRG